VYDDGDGPALVAGGNFSTVGGIAAARVATWNGSSWAALGIAMNGMNTVVFALHAGGGKLYAGGSFLSAGGTAANRVARWDGSSWLALGGGLASNEVLALALHYDGSGPALFAGGTFDRATDSGLRRHDGAGARVSVVREPGRSTRGRIRRGRDVHRHGHGRPRSLSARPVRAALRKPLSAGNDDGHVHGHGRLRQRLDVPVSRDGSGKLVTRKPLSDHVQEPARPATTLRDVAACRRPRVDAGVHPRASGKRASRPTVQRKKRPARVAGSARSEPGAAGSWPAAIRRSRSAREE
jgi:hypothetical protein